MGEEDAQHQDQGEEQMQKEDTSIRIKSVIFRRAKDPGTKEEEGGPIDWGLGEETFVKILCVDIL